MHTNYTSQALRQFRDQQIRFAARKKKIEQVDRAETLLNELEPDHTYTYEYVCFRITKYRPQNYPELKLSGADVSHDLRLFIEDLSDAADVAAESAGERVLTTDELSKRFKVSKKTITRWREQGLVARRFVFDGRKRVGFLQSSVDRFVGRNQDRVRRGAQFSHLRDGERQRIIDRARRLARAGGSPAEVTKRLAHATGRSVETIRHTLKQFDRENPDEAIFPDSTGALREATKQKIYQQYRRGEPVEALAREFGRTKASIYRIVNEMRFKQVLELPLAFIPNDQFSKIRTGREEKEILGPRPKSDQPAKKSRLPSGLPPHLASLYEVPPLSREQEHHLFQKMNYLNYKASKLRETLAPGRPKAALMDEIDHLYGESAAVREEIISANLWLVASIAKRRAGSVEDSSELFNNGFVSLIRAVEMFDFARGNEFSTYARRAIMKNSAQTIPDEHGLQSLVDPDVLDKERDSKAEVEPGVPPDRQAVSEALKRLTEREKRIIMMRFGFAPYEQQLTLRQIGEELGITKERVRQIQARALKKMSDALDQPSQPHGESLSPERGNTDTAERKDRTPRTGPVGMTSQQECSSEREQPIEDACKMTQLRQTETRRAWQIPFTEWQSLRKQLQEEGDREALSHIGGLTTDYAHRYNVEQAVKQGKPVPREVLKDYPDLDPERSRQ